MSIDNVRMCVDKISSDSYIIKDESGARAISVAEKRWQNGQTLRIRFLNGTPDVQERVKQFAVQWTSYANLKFQFVSSGPADIRIEFANDNPPQSFSKVGTDALSVQDQNEATMHYGWLFSNTSDEEYSRTVLHEFGHVMGLVHEHQNPAGGIKWNKPAVYAWCRRTQGWDEAQTDANFFGNYNNTITNYTQFDPNSIMLYSFPAELTLNGYSTTQSPVLSETDKAFVAGQYPFAANP